MPGLGASFGRGAATNYQQDLVNSDCVLFMGSNMAEAHPVGFRWPLRAQQNGAKLIHVDPRFTRTSAMCDVYVQIRAGTDIAFLGGIINYVITHERYFKEFLLAYTNAATIIEDEFRDTEDLGGVFSGFDDEKRKYKPAKGGWGYEGSEAEGKARKRKSAGEPTGYQQKKISGEGGGAGHGMHGYGLMGGASSHSQPRKNATDVPGGIHTDETLQHPHCGFQIVKKHYARYTPEMVAEVCGCTPEQVVRVAELLCQNSGRERTTMIVYAVGWTQHTTGVQIIRAAGLLQQLLGNVGRPGGGIMAMRGHASIQGSTDIPTLYDLLPGYLPQPAADKGHEKLDEYIGHEGLPTGYWANTKKFVVSLLKAWYGDAATAANDYRWTWLPRIDRDYSQLPFFNQMVQGKVKGYFLLGQNPAGGAPNAVLHRQGLRNLDWLVVSDWFLTDSATFWKDAPDGPPPDGVKTEVFFFPVAAAPEKEGSFTNTQRLIQWHDKALDPPDDCRSDAWFVYNLGKRLKALYKGSRKHKDQPLLHLTWDYDYDHQPHLPDGTPSLIAGEPDVSKVLQEINGFSLTETDPTTGKPKLLSGFADLKGDGSTACGCWIYSGVFPAYDHNRARDRKRTDNPLQPEWGFAWPHNRRVMYNRCSADPAGKPWSEQKKLLWWDEAQGKWVGPDVPDFPPDKRPDYHPGPDAKGMDALGGDAPFIMKPDGKAWLFSPGPAKDGPLPTHYEPVESPVGNQFYPDQPGNPTTRYFEGPLNPLARRPTPEFPVVACTFRLTEHYLSGPMSRFNSWLNELQPAMFVELSPELAAERGIDHGGWLVVRSPRGAIEARAMVTRRLRPLRVQGQTVHQIGIPFHWGYAGETVGSVANDLTSLVADPNVSMHEAKVFVCQVTAGRLPDAPRRPTEPFAPWPTRAPVPDTPRSAQPEGHLK